MGLIACRFVDRRRLQSVEYTMDALVTQRIYVLGSEYEDIDDHDRLRAASVRALAVGKGDLTGVVFVNAPWIGYWPVLAPLTQ